MIKMQRNEMEYLMMMNEILTNRIWKKFFKKNIFLKYFLETDRQQINKISSKLLIINLGDEYIVYQHEYRHKSIKNINLWPWRNFK